MMAEVGMAGRGGGGGEGVRGGKRERRVREDSPVLALSNWLCDKKTASWHETQCKTLCPVPIYDNIPRQCPLGM